MHAVKIRTLCRLQQDTLSLKVFVCFLFFFTGDGRLVQCHQSGQVPLPTGGLPRSKRWGGDGSSFHRTALFHIRNSTAWSNVACFLLHGIFFPSPAGAQADPKLHEGRFHGENGSKGLCCGSTHCIGVRVRVRFPFLEMKLCLLAVPQQSEQRDFSLRTFYLKIFR